MGTDDTKDTGTNTQGADQTRDAGGKQADTGGDGSATFTQADVNEIVKERLERERQKYADYDELKAKVETLETGDDTDDDTERLQKQLEAERKARERFEARARQRIIRSEIKAAATQAGFADPGDAYAFLDMEAVDIDDNGDVVGIDDQINALAENKPYLLAGGDSTPSGGGPTNPNRQKRNVRTDDDRRRDYFGDGGSRGFFEDGEVVIHTKQE